MPKHPWISDEGLRAFKRVKIGAADADRQHTRQNFTWPRRARLRALAGGKPAWLLQRNCLHGSGADDPGLHPPIKRLFTSL
jgi:hypothetical protein